MSNPSATRAAIRFAGVAITAGLLGACAGAIQTRPEDIPRLEQSVAQSPNAAALTNLGRAYHAVGRYDDARTTLQRAIAAGANDGTASFYLGLANEELGAFADARAAYEQYIATSTSGSMRNEIQARIALVARQELKEQAKVAIQREQDLAAEPPTPQSIAVLPFRLVGLSDEMSPLRTALADMIITDIGFTRLRSIERVRVQSLLDEVALTAGGITDEQTGARMGRMLRAERIVQGQLSGSGGQNITADAIVVNTTTRATPGGTVTRDGQLEAIFDLEKQLVFGILAEAQYTLSPTEREQINENRAANLLAFLAYGRGLEAQDRGDYNAAAEQFRQASQLDPNFTAARVQTTETAQLNEATQSTTLEVAAMQAAPLAAASSGSGKAPPTLSDIAVSIAADLNPSPATTVAALPTSSGDPAPPTPTNTVKPSTPVQDASQKPPIAQANLPVRIIITVPNPTLPKNQVRSGGM